ncbi:uncharacterized protein BCR38DRAFT_362064 [Pseudomassariella vexata]|uniref:DUF6594 domain-containing protein n=1 Tax=Pseudomassariella vexata TaxID=1141098 RepID=A0A1Y2EFX0_9PEZI|nr:uncharacterized protein BCR38DRAFT_362064 [Pseudomassariella vexata]ORY70317.1 hypothetical protein BCR38DRAFT_362064 [Pseudomassariella vexata]
MTLPLPQTHDIYLERQGGYTTAASWLARDSDNETLIFRKFDKLAIVNLLYMQSEILELEKRLDSMHLLTVNSYDLDLKDAASTWETLFHQSQGGKPAFRQDAKERMILIRELRERLKEYHEAILLQSQIAQLKHPEKRVLSAVKHFFEKPHPILGGKAKKFLNDRQDLVSLKTPVEADYLSSFLRRHWVSEKEVSRDGRSHFRRFHEKSISITVNIVTIIVALIFLIGPMTGLNFASNPVTRLVLIAVFTAMFAVSLGLITNARRAEVFGATAAYAAVLVVFVSNGGLSPAGG